MYYDYYSEVKDDVIDFIDGNIDYQDFDDIGELEDYLYDYAYESVTGCADGSYTYSRIEAAENLSDNFDLLAEALRDFDCGVDFLAEGAEMCDVLIRRYVFPESLHNAVKEIEGDFVDAHTEEQEIA